MLNPQRAWLLHTGAIGDTAMLWPLVRTLTFRCDHLCLAMPASLGRLTHEVVLKHTGISLATHDAQSLVFAQLFGVDLPPAIDPHATVVIDAIGIPHDNLRAAFPAASLIPLGPPGSASRTALFQALHIDSRSAFQSAPRAHAPAFGADAPIILATGAGSASKRWPLSSWLLVRDQLIDLGHTITLLAGPVESEQWTQREVASFQSAHGTFLTCPTQILTHLARARLVVSSDSGIGHIAAQLALPTLSLFGPTDPHIWQPTGPHVSIIAPPAPTLDMSWLSIAHVCDQINRLLLAHATDRID